MKKQILSAFLSLCLLLCALPVRALEAEEGREDEYALYEARYQTEENGQWSYGSLSDACANVYADGRVELLRDIRQPAPVTITKKMTLASADPETPCKITYTTETRSDYLLTVSSTVTLADIILDGGREEGLTTHAELVGVQGGALTMNAGAVIQNNDNIDTAKGAGGLRVINGQAVMQAGSSIRSCRGVAGGGAAVAGSGAVLVLNGGAIKDCEALIGGGVFLQKNNPVGAVYLYDGSAISGNQAKEALAGIGTDVVAKHQRGCGGGIFTESGKVFMQGAENGPDVSGNSAEKSGGGIYLNEGKLQFMMGSVTGNHAVVSGGGVLSNPGVVLLFLMAPRVTGNICDTGHFDNVFLDGGEENGRDFTWPIYIAMDLADGAAIGVSRWVRPDKDHPYRVAAVQSAGGVLPESDLEKFTSDDPAYVTMLHEGDIVLTNADVVFDTRGHGETPPGQRIDEGHDRKVAEPAEPEARGYAFGGWYQDTEFEEESKWDFDDAIIEADGGIKPIMTLYAKWTPIDYDIIYDMNDTGDGGESQAKNGADNPNTYNIESELITLEAPTREGYTFLGWTWEGQEKPQMEASIPEESTGDREFTAQWEKIPTYTVTYTDGADGAAFQDQVTDSLLEGDDTPGFAGGTPARKGYTFIGWLPEVADKVSGNALYTAQWKKDPPPAPPGDPEPEPEPDPEEEAPYVPPALESRDHFAYIVGYPDGTVQPEAHISRAEVASIFFRLMTEEFRESNWAEENPYPDVNPGSWYNNAVSTCTRAGLIYGFSDGTFGGERHITRAEFAAIAARFLSDETAPDSGFSDVGNHWAKKEIDRAVAAGWIKGFPDGTFRPNAYITRAEVMSLVNRMLGRRAAPEGMREDMIIWSDNPASAWYYAIVQEATNSHTYDRDGEYGPETWTGLTENRDWTELER